MDSSHYSLLTYHSFFPVQSCSMKSSDFVHLHCHSTYSLLEALPLPEEIAERAKELTQSAVALTDKGVTYGLIEFYKACKSQKLKPLLGMQVYIAPRSRLDREKGIDSKNYPLVLLAETHEGYQNLLELATVASLEGMYYKPRIDIETLKRFGKGLIALSGPLSGALPQAALAEDEARIRELTKSYRECVGDENLYFELMDLPSVPGQAEANQQLIRFARELKVPLVAACGSHYCRSEDSEAQDVLMCIQKNANVNDPGRFSMRDSDLSMRPFEELEKAFSHVPEALENTRIIADRCNVDLSFGQYKIPSFPVPPNETEASLLKKLCEEGIPRCYAFKPPAKNDREKEIMERVAYELSVINNMGFAGYFLIVSDFVNEAKRRGITVGPGRGSAAGSIVSYLLNITTLDPLEHGLLFERFLNPDRISMPDIDMDFADTRRDEVLEYVRQKYGTDRVVQICTFGTLAARAAVKDTGRVFGVPFIEMNELAKLISDRPGTSLTEALESAELRTFVDSNETYQKLMEIALKLEGKARHVSVHACGVVITPESAVHYTALQRAPKDENITITQYDAKPLEALGLVKMDFLGLKNLTIIQTALEIIERMHGKKIDIQTIPTDDKETFALLSRAETTGVFQLESGGMRRYLKQLKPSTFDDITAMVSLYRPGPMEKIPDYIKCKHGLKDVKYLHPDLEPILKPTYGVGIYQEQILEMARVFAGFTLGEADLLRRAIGKKIKHELDAQREKFIEGTVAKGYERQLGVTLFDDVITPFANYGFNKSHGASYARIAYETAYLKAHYPTEFMAALLSSENGDTDRISIEITEARAMGIQVYPPDINESLAHFTALPNNAIRFGLTAIKGVGESSVRQIIAIRDETSTSGSGRFANLEDFARRVPAKILNKKTLEALAKSGALDSFGDRGVLVRQYEKIADFSKSSGDIGSTQDDLFAGLTEESEAVRIMFENVPPASAHEKLAWEKETLGLFVSSHPLAGLTKYIGKKAKLIRDLSQKDVNRKITIAGILESIKVMRTKKGEAMAILTIEDPTGTMEVTLFPRTYGQAADLLEKSDSLLVIGGTLDARGGQLQVRADAIKRSVLSSVVEKAKAEGFFDEEEAKNGISRARPLEDDEPISTEEADMVPKAAPSSRELSGQLMGPLSQWILDGMDMAEPMKKLQLQKADIASEHASSDPSVQISIHTIELPAQASKQLLMDLKSVFEKFPGREKIQLKIGEKIVPVPLTVTMSAILESKIEKVLEKYQVEA